MASGSRVVVVAALAGNGLIAVMKLGAAALTGSAAMLSEGVHSVADTGNQALLLLGLRQAARPPDERFPFGRGNAVDPGDVEAAINAARVAQKAGITINTYALGPNALSSPVAAIELARTTNGTFLPVQNPGDIISFLQGVSFASVDDVVFTNLTTSEVSFDVSLNPDGGFSGFVPVKEGLNRVRITALTSGGASASVELDLNFERAGLSGRELELELERIRERNKHLLLLIERERIQRFSRRAAKGSRARSRGLVPA